METIKEIVCKNCKRLLEESTMKLVEIERLMGVSGSTIQRWKNGEHAPENDKLDKLAEILSINPQEFFKSSKDNELRMPMSKALKMALNVPDDIYELAGKLNDLESNAWGRVRDALEAAIETRDEKLAKNQKREA